MPEFRIALSGSHMGGDQEQSHRTRDGANEEPCQPETISSGARDGLIRNYQRRSEAAFPPAMFRNYLQIKVMTEHGTLPSIRSRRLKPIGLRSHFWPTY